MQTHFSLKSTRSHYDSELIPLFDQYATAHGRPKQVFFLHLLGSHFYYNDRYPPAFECFKPKQEGDALSYLNTVYFNDYVVSRLFSIAKLHHFDVVCYLSDHGEDMKKQHNMENYSRDMSTIPLLLYLAPRYASAHPGLAFQLRKNQDTPAMTDNFFHDIQVICGFRSSLFDPRNSFLTEEYIIRKRRVVNNTISFD